MGMSTPGGVTARTKELCLIRHPAEGLQSAGALDMDMPVVPDNRSARIRSGTHGDKKTLTDHLTVAECVACLMLLPTDEPLY